MGHRANDFAIGFGDDQVTEKTRSTDINGLMWEAFNPHQQDHEITEVYGPIA
jgi:hypothetical protein